MQIRAQLAHVELRMPLARFKRYQNIAIGVGCNGAVGKCKIESTVRETDVVEDQPDLFDWDYMANFLLDCGKVLLGIFGPHALRRVDVEPHLA